MKLSGVLVVGGLMFSACTDKSIEATVSPLRRPCSSLFRYLCVEYEESGTGQRGQDISGFEHRWGYEASVRFHDEEPDEVLADGGGPRHVLDEVISEELVITAPFDLEFYDLHFAEDAWFAGTTSPLDMRGTPVECEPAVCEALLATTGAPHPSFAVTFELTATDNVLRALAVH